MKSNSYTILGIDPGTNCTGYGVLVCEGKKFKFSSLGEIELHKIKDPYNKLSELFARVTELIELYRPDEVALESPFYGKNVQSMLKLGRAQGVAMAAALASGARVAEYAPRRVKQAITGNGGAAKEQVAAILEQILEVKLESKKFDATDGLAVAMCHYFTISSPFSEEMTNVTKLSGGKRRSKVSWENYLKANPEREIPTKMKKK